MNSIVVNIPLPADIADFLEETFNQEELNIFVLDAIMDKILNKLGQTHHEK